MYSRLVRKESSGTVTRSILDPDVYFFSTKNEFRPSTVIPSPVFMINDIDLDLSLHFSSVMFRQMSSETLFILLLSRYNSFNRFYYVHTDRISTLFFDPID